MVAFALALVGPLAGLYERYSERGNNSQLLLGSRAGFAVSPRDATIVRFTVGPQAAGAGIVAGRPHRRDLRTPLPPSMPVNEQRSPQHANDPAYIALGNLLFGTRQRRRPAHGPRPRRPGSRRHGHDWRQSYR